MRACRGKWLVGGDEMVGSSWSMKRSGVWTDENVDVGRDGGRDMEQWPSQRISQSLPYGRECGDIGLKGRGSVKCSVESGGSGDAWGAAVSEDGTCSWYAELALLIMLGSLWLARPKAASCERTRESQSTSSSSISAVLKLRSMTLTFVSYVWHAQLARQSRPYNRRASICARQLPRLPLGMLLWLP